MKISQLILDRWNDVQERGRITSAHREHYHRAQSDAEAEFQRDYLSNKAFAASDELHKRRVLRDIEKETRQRRQTALGVALHAFEPSMRELERELSVFKAGAQRAPDPVDAWLSLTGGERRFVNDEALMLADVAHEQRLTRLLLDTGTWQPSRWQREYERAVAGQSDPATVRAAASFLMFAESKHGDGWTGPTPASADEERAAVSLRKLIVSTQQARIPAEVADIETALAELKKIAARTRSLDGVSPINPEHELTAREVFEQETAALPADDGAEGAAVA